MPPSPLGPYTPTEFADPLFFSVSLPAGRSRHHRFQPESTFSISLAPGPVCCLHGSPSRHYIARAPLVASSGISTKNRCSPYRTETVQTFVKPWAHHSTPPPEYCPTRRHLPDAPLPCRSPTAVSDQPFNWACPACPACRRLAVARRGGSPDISIFEMINQYCVPRYPPNRPSATKRRKAYEPRPRSSRRKPACPRFPTNSTAESAKREGGSGPRETESEKLKAENGKAAEDKGAVSSQFPLFAFRFSL